MNNVPPVCAATACGMGVDCVCLVFLWVLRSCIRLQCTPSIVRLCLIKLSSAGKHQLTFKVLGSSNVSLPFSSWRYASFHTVTPNAGAAKKAFAFFEVSVDCQNLVTRVPP